jgi:hypothetical protein
MAAILLIGMGYMMNSRSTLIFFLLLAMLGSAPAAARDEAVACVQTYLNWQGYGSGAPDGQLGRRTTAAAEAFVASSGVSLPALSAENAAAWCDHANADSRYAAYRSFAYDGYGIIPRDVVFAAMQADLSDRQLACGFSLGPAGLESQEPITRISGFNSRMDNLYSVPGAREAETFVGSFAHATVVSYVSEDATSKTELLRILARWAGAGAFLGTESCVDLGGRLITSGKCAEWQDPEGQDPSSMKDATHSTFLMASLARAYLALLSDHETAAMAAEHTEIRNWITNGLGKRLKRVSEVYFGLNMGWYWPAINLDVARGDTKAARQKLARIAEALGELVNADGSIDDRTTRGDRALWYHYTSLGEVVMSMEMMRALDVPIDPRLEEHLHAAVDLFIRATADYAVIHPWARKRRNSSYEGETQDWDRYTWMESDFAGSWLHVYPYRYPGHPNAVALADLVGWRAKSASVDIDYGLGVGCLYSLAGGRLAAE